MDVQSNLKDLNKDSYTLSFSHVLNSSGKKKRYKYLVVIFDVCNHIFAHSFHFDERRSCHAVILSISYHFHALAKYLQVVNSRINVHISD